MYNHPYFSYIKTIFKDEYEQYLSLLQQPLHKAISINSNKLDIDTLKKILPISLHTNIFSEGSYLYDSNIHISDYALYHCGLFYSQEASASCAVDILDPKPGEKVLDCCSAPGGKSLQIATRIKDNGILVSNEYDSCRCNILSENIKRFGLNNTIVTNNDTAVLGKTFNATFDKILVDAPCSGEGMIKKNEDKVLKQWSIDYVKQCSKTQLEILNNISQCLKENGTLVFSTCTFNTIENEGVVIQFLQQNPDYILEKIDVSWGREGYIIDNNYPTDYCRRILPMDNGEGHFIAKFKKIIGNNNDFSYIKPTFLNKNELNYINDVLNEFNYHNIIKIKENLYGSNNPLIDTKNLNVNYYYGLLGSFKTKRFEPSPELALFNNSLYKPQYYELSLIQVNDYLSGKQIDCPLKGWIIVTYHNYPIGWIKSDGRRGNNKYIKSWRINYDVI